MHVKACAFLEEALLLHDKYCSRNSTSHCPSIRYKTAAEIYILYAEIKVRLQFGERFYRRRNKTRLFLQTA